MITAPNRLFDGCVSFAGGQDAGRNPVLLDQDQYQFGENVICRGGEVTTRPGLRELTLNFTNNIGYDYAGGHANKTFPNQLTSGTININSNIYTTPTISPSANTLVLMVVVPTKASAAAGVPTVTGNGLTWSLVTSVTWGVNNHGNISLFKAIGPNPTQGSVTINFGGHLSTQSSCEWSVVEFQNASDIVQYATNSSASATSLTVSLAAFSNASNTTYGAFISQSSQTIVPGTNFSVLHTQTGTGLLTEFAGSNQTSVGASGVASGYGGIALEILNTPSPIGSETAFTTGLFQCASFYDPSLSVDCLMASIGGRLFQIVPGLTSADVTELYLDQQNRGNIPIAYMVQADRFHITQDGENSPIIFDGVVARRAASDEIFTGTFMAYGLGRIVLVGKNLRDIYFGDLYGSHVGEPGASVLQFTETTFLSEGGAASLPFTLGHARGAVFIPEQDTTMGQGQLLVFAEKGMASFFLNLDRTQWKTSQFQALALIDIGATGDKTLTPVNSDIWFRSSDGWRTYRQARSEAKGWFQLPLSTEVGNYVDVETPDMLQYGSSIHFNNRLITTVTPVPNQGRPYHNGLLSLDFNVLSSFGQAAHKPSWDGHWSGLKFTQLVEGNFNGQHRAFAFGLDSDGNNALYEINEQATTDSSGPITSSIVPRSFTFQEYFNEGKLNGADLWVDNVRENTTFQMWFKPDDYPDWVPWMTSTQDPKVTITPIGVVGQISNGTPTLREGFSPRFSFIKPRPTIDPTTKRDSRRFYEMHQKIEWTGNASINRIRISQDQETEKAKATR